MSPRLSVLAQRTAKLEQIAVRAPAALPFASREPDPISAPANKVGPRPPKRSMHWLIALLLLGVGIATAYGYAQRKPVARLAAAETTAPVVELAPAELFTVKPAQLRHTVHLSGSLRPVHQSVLKAEVGARVGEVLVQEGQSVTKGDVLARLDRADVTSRLNEKLMLLEQASAQLALAEKTRAAKLELKEKGFATQLGHASHGGRSAGADEEELAEALLLRLRSHDSDQKHLARKIFALYHARYLLGKIY